MKRKQKLKVRGRGLLLIAIFKLVKAALLVIVGIGALTLLHKDMATAVSGLHDLLHVDEHNHFIHGLLSRLLLVDDRKLEAISAGSFFYAALLGTEGVGLLLRKRWAEYLTIIATASFIPLEIYELVKHFSTGKILVLVINLGVVIYLIYRVRHETAHGRLD
jgi:uncharacterized membrane protein (DUF2068 family)